MGSLLGTANVQIIIPLGVSAISFLLTVANVFLDFGNVLSQIEGERLVRDRTLAQSESQRMKDKDAAKNKRDQDTETIENFFQNKNGASDLVERGKRKNDVMNQYHLNVQEIEDRNLQLLEMDLLSYRERLVRLKEIDGGKARQRDDTGKDDSVNDYKDRKKPLDDMMKTIQDNAAEKMANLDMANMSAEEMNDEVET